MLGKTIAHYRIIEKVGEGGMGVVYKAEDTLLHRLVAIKFLPAEFTRDKIAKERFIQEAQSASALDHPNIGTIYEFNETDDGRLYMVMAYYEGDSLSKKIERGPLAPREIIDIATQIADGLSRAHAKGIVHRDIKSINLMVTRDHLVKILDFGVAKLIGQGDRAEASAGAEVLTQTIGTLGYMSPEQISGETVDDRTDIWSLGILMYQMATGELPFQGEYAQAVRYSVLTEQPKPINTFRSDLPPALEQIIYKALTKDLKKRYQHILELIGDLKKVQQQLSDTSGAPGGRKEKSKNNRIMFITGILVVICIFIISYLWLARPFSGKIDDNSISILPFKNLSDNRADDYFSDGITEDILTQISRIGGLKVISFNSSRQYKESDKSAAEIGRELQIRHLLQGTVRRGGDALRITVQLIDLKNDEVQWADTFEGNLNDIFSIQKKVAERVATALQVTLSLQEKQKLEREYTANLRAYDYYLKGREYYYRYRNEDNDNAILLFKKARDLDTCYAQACAGLADAYVQRTLRYGQDPCWLDSAMYQCQRALALDNNSAEAYKAQGLIYYTRSWFQKAMQANRAAIASNPNYDPALGNLGWIYYNLGKFDDAFRWMHKAVQLNPTNPNLNLGLGMIYLALQDYKQAREYLEIALNLQPSHRPSPLIALTMIDLIQNDLQKAARETAQLQSANPNDATLHLITGDAFLHAGNPGRAGEEYQKVLDVDPNAWQPFTGITVTTGLGFLFWKTEHPAEAAAMFDLSSNMDHQTLNQGSEWWGVRYDLAAIQAIQGKPDSALKLLQQAREQGFNLPAWIQIDPLFENLRGRDDFKQLIGEMTTSVQNMRRTVQPDH